MNKEKEKEEKKKKTWGFNVKNVRNPEGGKPGFEVKTWGEVPNDRMEEVGKVAKLLRFK